MPTLPHALLPLLLAVLMTAPVLAQSTEEVPVAETAEVEPEAIAVDSALVGEWTMDELTSPGVLAAYGVDVQSMTCTFSADGQAEVSMTAVQDGETLFRNRTFAFETADGEIIEEDEQPIDYQILEDGSLEITDDGMVIRFVRAAP